MSEGGESSAQYWVAWECHLTWKGYQCKKVGNQKTEGDPQANDEGQCGVVEYRKEDFKGNEERVEEDETIDDGREECGEGVEDYGWKTNVPDVTALRSIVRWRTTPWWRNRCPWKMRVHPNVCVEMET